ncbi:MAG TPA: DUF1571 domain-containing protein [Pirellulales bacterium]|nr:DUF1571 domain-containing protein [Pirellulales bacterium]
MTTLKGLWGLKSPDARVRRALLGLFLAAGAIGGTTLAYWLVAADGEADPSLMSSYRALVTYESAPKASSHDAIPDTPTLESAIAWAQTSLGHVREIRDYTCTLIKRERVGDRLIGPHYMTVKVRQQPYSVYLQYTAPQSVRNQEAIYVEGRNDGKLLAHPTGIRHRIVGTVALKPTSAIAMRGNRHPITEIGLAVLVEKLIVLGRRDLAEGSAAELTTTRGVLMNDRPCTIIEVRHPQRTDGLEYHIARIFIDEQMVLPVRFEAFGWPAASGEKPPLLEEYTYVDLKLNNGYTDADFDTANPQYGFGRGTTPEIRTTAQNQ